MRPWQRGLLAAAPGGSGMSDIYSISMAGGGDGPDGGPDPATDLRREKYLSDKLFKRLRRKVGQAIEDFGMIADGDRIVVCCSGGKDSWGMLDLLLSLRRSAPLDFELIPVHVDGGFPGVDTRCVEEHLQATGLEYHILRKPVYRITEDKLRAGDTRCSLCSRLRRGYLYAFARSIGAGKLALGHHKDDVVATLLLNLFFAGTLKTMPPVLRTDDDTLTVIRPLTYCRERDLQALADCRHYRLLDNATCSSAEQQQRAVIRQMMREWERQHPKRIDIIYRGITNVVPSHLHDRRLFAFGSVTRAAPIGFRSE